MLATDKSPRTYSSEILCQSGWSARSPTGAPASKCPYTRQTLEPLVSHLEFISYKGEQQHHQDLTTLAGSALAGEAKTAPKLGLHMASMDGLVRGLVSSPWGIAVIRAETTEQRL